MRPESLFFDRGGKQGLARAVSMVVTIAFLVLTGYSIIRYKHFAYLLRTELLTTPQFGWLLIAYAVLALLTIGIIRWANCRVKRMPALWAIGIRITSYNVCYTKLLRLQLNFPAERTPRDSSVRIVRRRTRARAAQAGRTVAAAER